MANDITTLAIQIRSQEAERNLRTFNELLSLGSQTAKKMEKVSIEIDVQGALAQLNALKAGYSELAASAQSLNLDMGGVNVQAPTFDTEALEALKEFFATSAEMSRAMREEMAQFNEALLQLEANSLKTATAGGAHTESMSSGVTMSREYAAALKEVAAAQKEMEKAAAKADEAMKATVAADEDAEAVKRRLMKAQRELAAVSKQVSNFHRTQQGDIVALSEKEEYLKNKVAELKSVYAEAKAAAEKFNQKLEESGQKADAARQRYQELKAQLDAMPKTSPMGGATKGAEDFSAKLRFAGRDVTKLTRGISGLAAMAGASIPGISGLGRAITMLGMGNPYLAAAAVAIAAIAAAVKMYDETMQDTAVAAREMAAEQAKLAESFQEEAQERQASLDRLAALNSYENLYDAEKEESRKIVEKLTAAYKGLEIQYDAVTGKVLNLAEVTKQMNEQDRQRLLEKQKSAVEMARSAAATQMAESQRNSVGWWRNANSGFFGIDLPGLGMRSSQGIADNWYNYINSAKDLEEQIKRINEAILHLDKVRQRGGLDAWGLDARDFSEQLKKAKTALLEYQKQDKIYREMQDTKGVGGKRSEADSNKALRAREAKLQAAKNAAMSGGEKYAENLAALDRLSAQKQAFSKMEQTAMVDYDHKRMSAADALLEIETEITNRTRERLAYEKKMAAEKAKLAALQRTYLLDDQGNVVRRRNSAEQAKFREQEIQEQKAKIDAMRGNPSTSLADLTKAQAELVKLQEEQIRYREAVKSTREQMERGRRGYTYDKNGNLLGRKTGQEIGRELEKQLAAAQAKLKDAGPEGSVEYYQARAELERLQREYVDQKTKAASVPIFNQQQQKAEATVVAGVQKRSSEALRLESRNFNRPENALNGWKAVEKVEREALEKISKIEPSVAQIAAANTTLANSLEQL